MKHAKGAEPCPTGDCVPEPTLSADGKTAYNCGAFKPCDNFGIVANTLEECLEECDDRGVAHAMFLQNQCACADTNQGEEYDTFTTYAIGTNPASLDVVQQCPKDDD